MVRYWVIAPVESKDAELFQNVWQFDLDNNTVSIGWSELGDISQLTREELQHLVAATYPEKPPQTKALIANMLWAFFHEVAPNDIIVARRGRKMLAAVGRVTRAGFYSPGRNPFLASADYSHHNFLDVEWRERPRAVAFPNVVFPMHSLSDITEIEFQSLIGGPEPFPSTITPPDAVEDQNAFVLEKYLEDFIVGNFETIFKGKLRIYEGPEGADGQQYVTDIGAIDILATEPDSNAFVVIELKKGRPSDQVVGQVLRYMGWVKKHLCLNGQVVKGLVVCREHDPKLSYALEMTTNVDVRYYSVSFKLRESPSAC